MVPCFPANRKQMCVVCVFLGCVSNLNRAAEARSCSLRRFSGSSACFAVTSFVAWLKSILKIKPYLPCSMFVCPYLKGFSFSVYFLRNYCFVMRKYFLCRLQLLIWCLCFFSQRTASLSHLPVEDLKDPLPPQWKCYVSPQGRRYYVNTTNNGRSQP